LRYQLSTANMCSSWRSKRMRLCGASLGDKEVSNIMQQE
jgi:hypothetical protein